MINNSTRHLCGLTHRQDCDQSRCGSWQGITKEDDNYARLASTYIFYLFAIETVGMWHDMATEMTHEIGRRIITITDDTRKTTKPNPANCKNCSSKCAYDCAQLQYTIQHRTVLIISALTSRQTS